MSTHHAERATRHREIITHENIEPGRECRAHRLVHAVTEADHELSFCAPHLLEFEHPEKPLTLVLQAETGFGGAEARSLVHSILNQIDQIFVRHRHIRFRALGGINQLNLLARSLGSSAVQHQTVRHFSISSWVRITGRA